VYAFEAISSHTRDDINEGLQAWHSTHRNSKERPPKFLMLDAGEIGWVMLNHGLEHDESIFVEISIVDRTEYGLTLRPDLGFVHRRCLKIGKPRAENIRTTSLIHAVGTDIELQKKDGNKFIKFLSAICQNMKKFSGPLIEAGFRGSDIDWLSPGFVAAVHQGMYTVLPSITVTNDIL
jgi:hypothetical protein